MVQDLATALNPVCRPIEVPLVMFLPCGWEIPDALRPAPITNAAGDFLGSQAGSRDGSEVRRRVCRQSMPIAVLPLDVIDQTAPVGCGDFRLWTGLLGRPNKRF